MLPVWVSNPGPLTYESGALRIALRGPAIEIEVHLNFLIYQSKFSGLYYYSRTIMARTGLGPSKKFQPPIVPTIQDKFPYKLTYRDPIISSQAG